MTPEQYAEIRQMLNFAYNAYQTAPHSDFDEPLRAILNIFDAILTALKPEPVGPITVAEELDRR